MRFGSTCVVVEAIFYLYHFPEWLYHLYDPVQNYKKLKAKMVLNMIFQQAIEDEIIVKNPLASKSIRITGRAPKPTKPYTVEQIMTPVFGT